MSAAPTDPGPTPPPAPPQAGAPSRSGRLITLIHKLLDYGRELGTALHQRAVTHRPAALIRRLGTHDIAAILARITRGIQLAAALETRIIRSAKRLDAGPRPASAAALRSRPTTVQPADEQAPDGDPRLVQLPTAKRIATEIRRRSIGAVLADIGRELGILPSDPLWHELTDAIIENGGPIMGDFEDMLQRMELARLHDWPNDAAETPPQVHEPAGTGPPHSVPIERAA